MNQLSNYDYSQNLFGNFTNRGGEQTRERSLRSSRGNYESQFKDSLQSSKVRHQNNLSHIKINDLLNYKRDENSINNLSPIDSRERSIHKSNSVRNADSDRNSAFLNKAFQMDELLKLREQYLKLEQKNKELEHALFIKNNEVLQLNQKIETMLVDNNQMRIDHAEIISKKDKTIQNLNLRLKEIKNTNLSSVHEKSRNNGISQSKSAISNYDLPFSKNHLNLIVNDDKPETSKINNLNKPVVIDQSRINKDKENKSIITNSTKSSKVAGFLMLDDLEKVYKKLPGMDRLEVCIDFTSDFKTMLKL